MCKSLSDKEFQDQTARTCKKSTITPTIRGRIEWNGVEDVRQPCVVIDGRRMEWNDFGAILMAFEGWQFRLELPDPSDEA